MPQLQERDNTIFVGTKDVMKYVFSVSTQATKNDEIILKARGKTISKCVDVSQISLNTSLHDWMVKSVDVGTHQMPLSDEEREAKGRDTQNVSYIEIILTKK